MFQPPNKVWTLIFVCVVFALPLPPAERSRADNDEVPLQSSGDVSDKLVGGSVEAEKTTAAALQIDVAALEARLLARLRHEMHSEVDDVAMRSMEQAMHRLRGREGEEPARALGKVLRLTFELEPEVPGVAPVSVMTRTSSYSAFADTAAEGTNFRLNVAGGLTLKGMRHDRVIIDFSTLLQFDDNANDESGSSGASGSAEVTLGRPEVLMSVGARDLVLTISEVR